MLNRLHAGHIPSHSFFTNRLKIPVGKKERLGIMVYARVKPSRLKTRLKCLVSSCSLCLKPTVSSRPSVPVTGLHECLRFDFELTHSKHFEGFYFFTYLLRPTRLIFYAQVVDDSYCQISLISFDCHHFKENVFRSFCLISLLLISVISVFATWRRVLTVVTTMLRQQV